MLTRWRWPPLELVRVPAAVETRIEPDAPQQRAGALAGLGARATVHEQAEGHGVLDRQARVQRGVGVLEDELHVAAQALHARRRARRARPRRRTSASRHPARSVGGPAGPASTSRSRTRRRCRASRPGRRRTTRRRPRAPRHTCAAACRRAGGSACAARAPAAAASARGRAHARISMASRRPSESRLNAIDVTKMARPGSAGHERVDVDRLAQRVQHQPPLGGRRRDAEPEEGQAGGQDDGERHLGAGEDQDRAEHVGQQMVAHDRAARRCRSPAPPRCTPGPSPARWPTRPPAPRAG